MTDLFSLKDKVVVITGGLGQLGQEFCVALYEAGAKVALIDRATEPKGNNSKFREIFHSKDRVRLFSGNILSRADLEKTLFEIEKQWGTPWGLINNAALDSPPDAPPSENGPFETYPEVSLDQVIDVNLKGTILCCQVFGGAMAKNKGGSIVNISSIYGMVSPVQDIYEFKRQNGDEWYKPVSYSVSKSAIFNLTRYLATYWGEKGVRVNTLTPAGIYNSQDERFLKEYLKRMPMRRMAKPDELNGAIVFMLSNASSYMTGSNVLIDGGWTAW